VRLISEIKVSVETGRFPDLMSLVFAGGCEISGLELLHKEGARDIYAIEVLYNSQRNFKGLVDSIKKNEDHFGLISVNNVLEEMIRGGMLYLGSKIPLENDNDFQMNILGTAELVHSRIDEGLGDGCTGISRAVGYINGIKSGSDRNDAAFYHHYIDSELESIMLNRFSDLMGMPLIISYDHGEDLIRSLQRIEASVSALKIRHVNRNDIQLYEQIYSAVSKPVVSSYYDDIPAVVMAMLLKIQQKNRLKVRESTVGIIGIDVSSIRFTKMLIKMGFMKVLGYDISEKQMLTFENMGGLATTIENIFGNTDIMIIVKNDFTLEDYQYIRPGQVIISLVEPGRINRELIRDRGVREFAQVSIGDIAPVVPGLMRGAISSGRQFDDDRLIKIAKDLSGHISDSYRMPELFSGIHEIIFEAAKL